MLQMKRISIASEHGPSLRTMQNILPGGLVRPGRSACTHLRIDDSSFAWRASPQGHVATSQRIAE